MCFFMLELGHVSLLLELGCVTLLLEHGYVTLLLEHGHVFLLLEHGHFSLLLGFRPCFDRFLFLSGGLCEPGPRGVGGAAGSPMDDHLWHSDCAKDGLQRSSAQSSEHPVRLDVGLIQLSS